MPPPLSLLRDRVPLLESVYNNFFKQWHYKMEIEETCKDPQVSPLNCQPIPDPANTAYPSAVICGKDMTRSCFSSGDSGSPLMIEKVDGRFQVEGVLSFVKGCYRLFEQLVSPLEIASLGQLSENPSVYTKLLCYLPWIAKQYDMTYDFTYLLSGYLDQTCLTGSGEENSENQICRATVSWINSQ